MIGHDESPDLEKKRRRIWKPDLVQKKTEQNKFEVMIWGCICLEGVETMAPVEGNINFLKYQEIQEYMVRNNITCLSWPAQSPDLINMIENVWLYIKRKLQFCSGAVKSKADLIEEITFRACMA